MATERPLNSDQEVVLCSITGGFKSILFKRLASPTSDHPLQPQAGSILKHLLVIQSDARMQSFCCLTPESRQSPSTLVATLVWILNTLPHLPIKTWVLETCVFQITAYILGLRYFQGQIMKATKALKIHSGHVFQGIFTASWRPESAQPVAMANSKYLS